jgi:hypothetical protein
MKSIILTGCIAVFLFSCNGNKTEEKKQTAADTTAKQATPAPEPTMDSAAMMKAWQDYMTPGPMHAMMAKYNGTFTEDVTVWMAPGAPEQKSTATATNKMIMGGRYQESHSTGNFGGMPFEGSSLLGYDNHKKIFQSTWIDNMGSGIMNLEGTWDSTAKAINFKGTMCDPMTGKDTPVREVITFTDDNTQKIEMYAMQGGKEHKSMEIVCKRKGK